MRRCPRGGVYAKTGSTPAASTTPPSAMPALERQPGAEPLNRLTAVGCVTGPTRIRRRELGQGLSARLALLGTVGSRGRGTGSRVARRGRSCGEAVLAAVCGSVLVGGRAVLFQPGGGQVPAGVGTGGRIDGGLVVRVVPERR